MSLISTGTMEGIDMRKKKGSGLKPFREGKGDLFIEERLAVLGKLAESISHEIRNPLNVISTSAYYLKMKLNGADERIKERIGFIEQEVQKTLALIDSIINLSGMKEPRMERTGLVNVVKDAVTDSRIPDTVELIMDMPPNEIFMDADPRQLNILFGNIITNALESMNNTGKLVLSVKKAGKREVELLFADTGSGIAPGNMDKLFQPLFTTKPRGFGFGLLVCKMIVEKHGGTIGIKSEQGKGTTVTLMLPSV